MNVFKLFPPGFMGTTKRIIEHKDLAGLKKDEMDVAVRQILSEGDLLHIQKHLENIKNILATKKGISAEKTKELEYLEFCFVGAIHYQKGVEQLRGMSDLDRACCLPTGEFGLSHMGIIINSMNNVLALDKNVENLNKVLANVRAIINCGSGDQRLFIGLETDFNSAIRYQSGAQKLIGKTDIERAQQPIDGYNQLERDHIDVVLSSMFRVAMGQDLANKQLVLEHVKTTQKNNWQRETVPQLKVCQAQLMDAIDGKSDEQISEVREALNGKKSDLEIALMPIQQKTPSHVVTIIIGCMKNVLVLDNDLSDKEKVLAHIVTILEQQDVSFDVTQKEELQLLKNRLSHHVLEQNMLKTLENKSDYERATMPILDSLAAVRYVKVVINSMKNVMLLDSDMGHKADVKERIVDLQEMVKRGQISDASLEAYLDELSVELTGVS